LRSQALCWWVLRSGIMSHVDEEMPLDGGAIAEVVRVGRGGVRRHAAIRGWRLPLHDRVAEAVTLATDGIVQTVNARIELYQYVRTFNALK